jgi:GNAT superfamily N-acetyltransferase
VNQRLYREVGEPWQWTRCQGWSVERWTSHLESSAIATIVHEIEGTEIGYAELINRSGDVEILSFGLLEAFIGQGLGSAALTLTVQYAWTLGAVHHVWLHTCDKDHPNARNTYQRRGFVHSDTKDNRVGQSKILP